MLMVMCMKDNGIMIKHKEEELTNIPMVPFTLEIGKKTDKMAMELKHGLITLNMKVITNLAKSMELVHLNGQMVLLTLVNFSTTIFMEKECILGQTIGDMKVSGVPIKCMVKEPLLGLMVESM